MFNLITSDSITLAGRNDRSSNRVLGLKVLATLAKKELREIGFFALLIMVASLLFVLLSSQFYAWTGWARQLAVMETVGAVFLMAVPIMIVLACGSAMFSMEHENNSFEFLRSLPVSASQIFSVKLFVLGAATLIACLIFWPIALNGIHLPLIRLLPVDQETYPFNATRYLTFLIEAALWAIFFSLRERKVLWALIKASTGLFVISYSLNYFAYANIFMHELDVVVDRIAIVVRLGFAFFLAVWISFAVKRWLRDQRFIFVLPEFRFLRRTIHSDRWKSFVSIRRLVWLQFRSVGILLVFFAVLFFVTTTFLSHFTLGDSGYGEFGRVRERAMARINVSDSLDLLRKASQPSSKLFYVSIPVGQLCWIIASALMGMIACKGALDSAPTAVNSGYSPRKIWFVHSFVVFFFCLATALSFKFFSTGYILYKINLPILLLGFSAGQVAAIYCRSIISACVVSGFLAATGWFLLLGSRALFVSQIPTVFWLAILPLLLVALVIKPLATVGHCSRSMRFSVLAMCLVTLVPFPLLRIFEVPTADVSHILEHCQPSEDPSSRKLIQEARQAADQFGKISRVLEFNLRSADESLRPELENNFIPLWVNNANQKMLLDSSAEDLDDLRRLSWIHAVHTNLVFRGQSGVNAGDGEHSFVNKLMTTYLNWNLNLPDSSILFWWASHPETKPNDIKKIIKRLENEDEVFELIRSYRVADFLYATRSYRAFKHQSNITYGHFLQPWVVYMPWERERYTRGARRLLAREWNAVDEIQRIHKDPTRVDELVYNLPSYFTDRISHELTHFSVTQPQQIANTLYWRRASRVYLALLLWQREHSGQMPKQLAELEGVYLEKLPVSPFDESLFHFDPNGFTQDDVDGSNSKTIKGQWNRFRYYGESVDDPPSGRPILWIHVPSKDSSIGPKANRAKETAKTKEDLVSGNYIYGKRIWFLPRAK